MTKYFLTNETQEGVKRFYFLKNRDKGLALREIKISKQARSFYETAFSATTMVKWSCDKQYDLRQFLVTNGYATAEQAQESLDMLEDAISDMYEGTFEGNEKAGEFEEVGTYALNKKSLYREYAFPQGEYKFIGRFGLRLKGCWDFDCVPSYLVPLAHWKGCWATSVAQDMVQGVCNRLVCLNDD